MSPEFHLHFFNLYDLSSWWVIEARWLADTCRWLLSCDLWHHFLSTTGWGLLFITSFCLSLPFLALFCFIFLLLFGSSFVSYAYFLDFPDDFCMLLLLSVSTVTARVSSRRSPDHGKLCTHGIIFEWPLPPPHAPKQKIKCTQTKDSLAAGSLTDWWTEPDWLILWLIGEVVNETIRRLAIYRMALQ